jgi:glycosyltransferase involved in cell wall biosynthesis
MALGQEHAGSVSDLPHVVHVIDELPPDGAERLIVDLLQSRSGRFRYTVLCIVRGGPMVQELERMGIPVVVLRRRPGIDLGTLPALIKWLRRNDVAVVHTHLYAADTYGRVAAKLAGIRVQFSTRHNTVAWTGFGRRMLAGLLARLSTRVIACGDQVGRVMQERESIGGQRLVVIPNGINLRRFDNADRHALRRELAIGDDTVLLGVVGRLHAQKGHSDLLNALAALPASVSQYRCVIVGSGPLEQALRLQCARLDLAARVQFLGQRDDIPNVLAALDIFVMPSRWEGLPMALLEAMSLGCAVIATSVGEIPGVISDGSNGRLVAPQNTRQLGEALQQLLQDPAMRRQMGESARRTVTESFSAEKTARAYENLYESALCGNHG